MTYRDLGSDPIPHFDSRTGLARMIPPDERTPEQNESWNLTELLICLLYTSDAADE